MTEPRTEDEWREYIAKLAGPALRSKAISANTMQFFDQLMGEGYDIAEVRQILVFFGLQMKSVDLHFPEGGAYDYRTLVLEYTEDGGRVLELSEEQADQLAGHPPDEGVDDLDQALNQIDLEGDWSAEVPL